MAAKNGDIILVHSSDLHVDDDYTARLYGGDGTAPLAAVIEAGRESRADMVLLAGDIFECNRLPAWLLERAAALLAKAGRPVVLLPGNHDPAVSELIYHAACFARVDNIHVLGVTHPEQLVFPALDLEIWGRPHRDYGDMAPLADPPARASTRWRIVMAHGHYDPMPDRRTNLHPSWLIGSDELEAVAADYVALGHWNRTARVGTEATQAWYCGSPDYAGSVNLVRLAASGEVSVSAQSLPDHIRRTG